MQPYRNACVFISGSGHDMQTTGCHNRHVAHLSTSAVPRPVFASALRTDGSESIAASVPSDSGSFANTIGTVSSTTRCCTLLGSAASLPHVHTLRGSAR